jgi:alkanesulfonate monooxygenase SsuD/methylene tetrahydromethanopterin reductase-like flavin-dependent oxidoreductase (luciferase family)
MINFGSPIGVGWSPELDETNKVVGETQEIEELGFGALRLPKAVGREVLTLSASLLAKTRPLVIGTGIANTHARDPRAAAAGARTLNALHPGRYVLGLGVSHARELMAT